MELTGKIKLINDVQSFDSGFTKREFVVTTDEQYPQDIKFETIKEKCSMLDNYKTGSLVKVSFNIRGNEYQGRYFVNLQAWRIEGITATESAPVMETQTSDSSFTASGEDVNDLPF